METKEMSFEEKYDKLYDQYIMTDVIAWAFVKEMGLTDKYLDYSLKVYKKMVPSGFLGSAFKLIKMLAPGRAFNNFVKSLLRDGQVTEPLSNTEIVSLSDREAKVLKMRFGLAGYKPMTLEEVGREFGVTRERIRQIEAKALRKLKHPSRRKKLQDYLE